MRRSRLVMQVGDTIWFLRYDQHVCSGEVVALKERANGRTTQLVVDHDAMFFVLDKDPSAVFGTLREAYLAAAQKHHQEASQRLTKAADLFRLAGLEMAKQAPAADAAAEPQ